MTILDPVKLSQDLIKIPSYSGFNFEVIELIKNILSKENFACDILEYDGDESYKVNNLHAVFNPNNSEKILYFAGHTDVVNEGNKSSWTHDPFAAKIVDDKLFGRGASDMKCAIACFISAALQFLSENKKPDFGIGFLITNDEENDSINGTQKVLKWMKENNKKITHCLVGEPTNPESFGEMIKIGRRGSIGFSLKITGKQGHVAYPDIALNPITILINLLKILKDHKLDSGNRAYFQTHLTPYFGKFRLFFTKNFPKYVQYYDKFFAKIAQNFPKICSKLSLKTGSKFFDPSNLEITHIQSQNLGNNVIPNEAFANFNIRFNDSHSSKSIIEFVEYACQKTIGFGAKYELTHRTSGESFLSDPKFLAPLVEKAVEKVTGKKPEFSTSGGTSDARFIKDFAEVVEIGLVNKTAHKIDEFSKIEEIHQLQKTYLEILKNF